MSGENWQDKSVATRLLEVMPVLEELAIPEPPKELTFFEGPPHPLRTLNIENVDLYPCVAPLAECLRFSKLQELHLCESFRTDVQPRVPAADHRKLFKSNNFPALKVVTLAQVGLSDKQQDELRSSRLGSQLESLSISSAEPWCDRPILGS